MTPRPYRDFRLTPGHRLSAEGVAANQRWRLIGAAAEVLAKRGLPGTTARLIAREAAVSPTTFYRHFDGVDDLLAAAFTTAAEALEAVAGEACAHTSTVGATEAVLQAVLDFSREESALCGLVGLGPTVAVPEIARERERWGLRVAELLGAARGQTEPPDRHRVAGALALIVDQGGEAGDGLVGELARLLA